MEIETLGNPKARGRRSGGCDNLKERRDRVAAIRRTRPACQYFEDSYEKNQHDGDLHPAHFTRDRRLRER